MRPIQWRIQGAASDIGGAKLLFSIVFAENLMKIKQIGLRGGCTTLLKLESPDPPL